MAGKIRGITIEIGGDTKGLVNSLKSADKEINSTKKQLKDVEKLLKLDPTNTTLLEQKQKLLTQAVEQTTDKLEKLKDAQKEMDAEGIDKSSAQYMALEREIIATTQSLQDLEQQAARSNVTLAKIGAVADKISSGAKKVSNATRGMSTAAGAALGGIAGMAYNAAVMSDDLNTLAKQTGFTTADLQKMQYAADRMDVSMETITGSAARMTRQLIDNEEKFTEIGVATRDADGQLRSTTDIFYDTAKALSNIENETERDTKAMDIFGRSANELAGVVDDGGAVLKAYGEEMEALGLVLSQDTLDSLNAVNDEIDQIKAQALATFATSGATALQALSPVISQVVGFLDQLFQKIAGLDEQQIQTIVTILAIVAAISPVAGIIGSVAGAISTLMPLLSGILPVISSIFAFIAANPIILIVGGIIAAIALIATHWEQITAFVTEKIEAIKTKYEELKTKADELIAHISTVITEGWNQAWNTAKETISELVTAISEKWEEIKNTFSQVIEYLEGTFSSGWTTAWETVKGIFDSVFGGIQSIAENIMQTVIDKINAGIELVNAITEKINAIPFVNIPQIPLIEDANLGGKSAKSVDGGLAKGGSVTRGTYFVGEAGPEVLTVAGGRATVTPLSGNNAPHTPLAPARISPENFTTNVNVQFSGSLAQLAHILTPEIKAETVRVGAALVK